MSNNNGKRLLVLGAGPGGYPAAFYAAHLGMDVTLIDERANPGGVCLYVGCIPSKALLHVAKLINEAHESSAWGVTFDKPKIDLDKLRAFKDKVVSKMTGGLGMMSKAHKIKFIQGRGEFTDANTLSVTDKDGKKQDVSFDAAIVATGSRPAMPKALAIGSKRVMDSSGALELPEIPKSMLVIGGGYIGLEMGTVYAALGSKITVVEMLTGILPGADRDLVDVLGKSLKGKFEAILTDTRVTEMSETKDGIKVKLVGVDLNEERTYDRVLITVGRAPNSQNLGLEKLGIKVTERGFIEVNPQRATNVQNIFAIGDVAGEPGLAHKATHEARVAVDAVAGNPAAFDPATIPAVVFTDPEVAWAGLTETQCLNQGVAHKVTKFPWAASGRAATLGRQDGLTKLIIDPRTGRVLGCGIVGVGAGDLIAEAALAIEMGATAEDLALTIHPHPTMSETIMEAADLYLGHSAHLIVRK
ncbi:MAG: dihydrolipoyl dehydrogenase [Planctomycetes bacterium]|nr:dihydrolipoyl dehydrogenase [Planctomycetota bacterium]